MFRNVFRILGVLVATFGFYQSIFLVRRMLAGQIGPGIGILGLFISVGLGIGLGMLMIFANPHSLIQNYWGSLYKMVKNPVKDRRSFAEKIRAEDDE